MIDWEKIREECIQTGEMIKIEKEKKNPLPPFFHETTLGLSKGAIHQYRDDRATHTLHIHEFPDYFLAHVDIFNPEYHPVAHGVMDTPGMTLGMIVGAIGLYLLVKTYDHLSFLPDEEPGD